MTFYTRWATLVLSLALCVLQWPHHSFGLDPTPSSSPDSEPQPFGIPPPIEELEGYQSIDFENDLSSKDLGYSPKDHIQLAPPPKIVFRSGKLSPDEMRSRGGMYEGTLVPPTNANGGFSIFYHHCERLTHMTDPKRSRCSPPRHLERTIHLSEYRTATAYTATSRSFGVSLSFATREGPGWVYMIQATPNMIDVDGTLRNYRQYRNEQEFVALGGVHWGQVLRYIPVPGKLTAADFGKESPHEVTYTDFIKKFPNHTLTANPDYDPRFDNLTASPGEPQLAGWADRPAKVNKLEPWSRYQNKTLGEYARDFMDSMSNEAKAALGWNGTFPLEFRSYPKH
ncbi:putative enterotoxin [Cordyceps sp. RAO-2017]|nr:putative enterotoxin [Cordyceps sp. RAO-2017]